MEEKDIKAELIELGEKMHIFRGKKVLLDADVAAFFTIPLRTLNQFVKRNSEYFPENLMFGLNDAEMALFSRSHFVIIKKPSGKAFRYPPAVFTEKGIMMLVSILSGKKAFLVHLYLLNHFAWPDFSPIIAF